MKWLDVLKNNDTLFDLSEWEYFVWRHRGKLNLFFHFVSFTTATVVLIYWAFTMNHWLLLIVPITQYIGFYGHKFEEGGVRSKDFISPMTSIHLCRIFFLIAIRKYPKLINEIEEKVEKYKKAHE